MNFYWQLPCSSKPFTHRVCMNSSAGTLHRASFSLLNPHISRSKYIKTYLHGNTRTSIEKQSGSYIHKTTFACEYRQLHKRPHTHLQVHTWLRVFWCKHIHTQATIKHNHSCTWKHQKLRSAPSIKPEIVTSWNLYCPTEPHLNFIPFQFTPEFLSTVNPFQGCETWAMKTTMSMI